MSNTSDTVTLEAPRRRFSFAGLHAANTRIRELTVNWRSSLHLTHHAKRRAMRLNLRVDVVKAVNCDHRQVSVIPLPIIVTDPSPVLPTRSRPRARRNRPMTPQPMPIDVLEHEIDVVDSEGLQFSVAGPSSITVNTSTTTTNGRRRPPLRCLIPINVLDIVQPEISYFSSDSEGPPMSPTVSASFQPFSPCSPANVRDTKMASPSPGLPLAAPRLVCPSRYGGGNLLVPEDIGKRLSWGCGEATLEGGHSDASRGSSPVLSLSGSLTDTSSEGPTTPDDPRSGLMLRINKREFKRKSIPVDSDQDIREVFEKRPKFERKEWAEGQRLRPVRSLPRRF